LAAHAINREAGDQGASIGARTKEHVHARLKKVVWFFKKIEQLLFSSPKIEN
jgi:hypothetical protein